jgi:hypothetical protein
MPKRKADDAFTENFQDKSLDKSLEEANSIAENEVVVEPTKNEIDCISSFCNITLQCKKITAEAKEKLKETKPVVKNLRGSLLKLMKEQEDEVLVIPQDLRKEADAQLSTQAPKTPCYIRLTKNTKDIAITPEIIQEAFGAITSEDILEAEEDGAAEAVVQTILKSIRRLVRSFTEQIKLTDTLPRGTRAADVKVAQSKLSVDAITLHEKSTKILATEKLKRETLSTIKADLEKKSAEVEKFFQRANVSSQRINLQKQAYNLCCRTTVCRPRMSLKIMEDFLEDAMKKTILHGKKPLSKQEVAESLDKHKKEILSLILTRIQTVPVTSKSVVHLQKVGVMQE